MNNQKLSLLIALVITITSFSQALGQGRSHYSVFARAIVTSPSLLGGVNYQNYIGNSNRLFYSADLSVGYMNSIALNLDGLTDFGHEGVPVFINSSLGYRFNSLSFWVGQGVRYTYMFEGYLENEVWKEYRDDPNSKYAGGEIHRFKENDLRLYNSFRIGYQWANRFRIDLDFLIQWHKQPHGAQGYFSFQTWLSH